jgi:hypothetical protein
MRRFLSIPVALILIAVLGAGVASADPVNGRNSFVINATCDGATGILWVSPAHGHAFMDTGSTTNTVVVALTFYDKEDVVLFSITSPSADAIPAALLTTCTGDVPGTDGWTFSQLVLITPAHH